MIQPQRARVMQTAGTGNQIGATSALGLALPRRKGMAAHLDLCDELFASWLRGAGLRPDGYASGRFQTACCPEPCLVFEEGDEPPAFVTMNPGPRTGPQLRSAVDGPSSPIRSDPSHRENARRLSRRYAGIGGGLITRSADAASGHGPRARSSWTRPV